MGFKYELHTHTAISSRCGRFTPEELVDTFLSQNYTGIFTTDHFFNGNTAAPGKDEPWKYRVEKYCDGFRSVKKEGDKRGLDVFFGFEYSVAGAKKDSCAGCDFLVFGLDEEWLVQNGGDVEEVSTKTYLNRCREAGGLVIQAHPYRFAGYMDHICLFPDCVDGVEILNTSPNTLESNALAHAYADYYRLIKTAGSDIHANDRELLGVTEMPEKAKDIFDFIKMLREGKQKLYIAPNGKCNFKPYV